MNNRTEPAGAADILSLAYQYRAMTLAITALSLAAFLTAAAVLPRKYKTHYVVTIYAKYFQNPLIQGIVTETSDSGELKAQRESLIRQAMTPEFLDGLAEKHGLYAPGRGGLDLPPAVSRLLKRMKEAGRQWGLFPQKKSGNDLSAARQRLLSRIEVFPLNNTTFQVGFVDPDPSVTFLVTRELYNQVIHTLLEVRTRNLVNIRDPIRKRLESLAFNMASSPDPRASVRPQLVREELSEVRGQLRALTTQYTEDHPLIAELRDRERILLRWLNNAPGGGIEAAEPRNPLVGGESPESARDAHADLTQKMDYLNIALESDKANQAHYFALLEAPIYPVSPLWPKTPLFALWGLGGGLLASLFLAAVRNYFDRSRIRAESLADRLGVPILGALPAVPWRKALPRAPQGAAMSAPQLTNGRARP